MSIDTNVKPNVQPKTYPIPEIYCEDIIRMVCGDDWRTLPQNEVDGAIGVAICRSLMDGCNCDIRSLSKFTGIEPKMIHPPLERLSLNGITRPSKLNSDKALKKRDTTAWCYIAGYASGLIGVGS